MLANFVDLALQLDFVTVVIREPRVVLAVPVIQSVHWVASVHADPLPDTASVELRLRAWLCLAKTIHLLRLRNFLHGLVLTLSEGRRV